MYSADFKKYVLQFRQPSGTSRGILTERISWFILLTNERNPGYTGIGECGPLKGLSNDDRPDFEENLAEVCNHIDNYLANSDSLNDFPSVRFGLEMAFLDLKQGGGNILFPSPFTQGRDSIPVNGLVWMGTMDEMISRVNEKLNEGFTCLKLKIGALNFESELDLIRSIREKYSASQIEIRVDANGAFKPHDALEKIKRLSDFRIHSVEQPIAAGQYELMEALCAQTPVPIALDEELIGISESHQKAFLLDRIKPQYIILKPTLLGGFRESEEWIELASERNTGWWVTSALESNIGLNAIAQWAYIMNNPMPQGLGTGQLYRNNFDSPLKILKGKLFYQTGSKLDFTPLMG